MCIRDRVEGLQQPDVVGAGRSRENALASQCHCVTQRGLIVAALPRPVEEFAAVQNGAMTQDAATLRQERIADCGRTPMKAAPRHVAHFGTVVPIDVYHLPVDQPAAAVVLQMPRIDGAAALILSLIHISEPTRPY